MTGEGKEPEKLADRESRGTVSWPAPGIVERMCRITHSIGPIGEAWNAEQFRAHQRCAKEFTMPLALLQASDAERFGSNQQCAGEFAVSLALS